MPCLQISTMVKRPVEETMKRKPKFDLHLRRHDGPVYFRELLSQRQAGASLGEARAAARVRLLQFREEIKQLPAARGKTNKLKQVLGL